MYLPNYFSQHDEGRVRELIQKNGFATVLSYPKNEKPFINHLPVVFSSAPQEENTLIGHMAKRNPQWNHFREYPDCTMIFHGGHTYITPTWYKSGRDVPTWNYAVVHLQGKIELIETFEEQVDILKQLSKYFESPNKNPWIFELPEDLLDKSALTSAIISFKFSIENIDAKFKLSQNRPVEDRQGIIDGLSERSDEGSRAVRELMLQNERGLKR